MQINLLVYLEKGLYFISATFLDCFLSSLEGGNTHVYIRISK